MANYGVRDNMFDVQNVGDEGKKIQGDDVIMFFALIEQTCVKRSEGIIQSK